MHSLDSPQDAFGRGRKSYGVEYFEALRHRLPLVEQDKTAV